MALEAHEETLRAGIAGERDALVGCLERLVGISSHTRNKAGVEALGRVFEEDLEALGLRTSLVIPGTFASHVVARTRAEEGHRLLLLGHLDTVHPADSPFRSLARSAEDPDVATGPGAADMKGGLAVLLFALRALEKSGRLAGRRVTVVLTSDEEASSPTSAGFIEAEAQDHDLCLVLEPGSRGADGATTFVTERRGAGRIRLEARGLAAHAGVEPERGLSAIREMAAKVLDLEKLSDPPRGVSVSVGTFHGGTSANTIPADAQIEVDYRFREPDDGQEIADAVLAIARKPYFLHPGLHRGAITTVAEHAHRPPLARSEASGRMAGRIAAWGRDLGLALREESRGGASDGNNASTGCPTVDGMGAVGGRLHTSEEWVSLRSLVDRTQLLALTMDRFFRL